MSGRHPSPDQPKHRGSVALGVIGVLFLAAGGWLLVTFLDAINRNYLDLDIQGLDPATGEVAWELNGGGTGRPIFGESSIVVVGGGGVDAIGSDGTLRWRFKDGRVNRAHATAGTVIIESTNGLGSSVLIALDEPSGNELWRASGGGLGHSVGAGDSLILWRDGRRIQIFEARTGRIVGEFTGNLRDATISADVVAAVVGRSLHVVSAERTTRQLVRGVTNASVVALTDSTVVLETAAESSSRPRPRVLTGYDVLDGEVRWELEIGRRDSAVQLGAVIRLERASGFSEVDIETGRRPTGSAEAEFSAAVNAAAANDQSVTIERVVELKPHDGSTRYFLADRYSTAAAASTIAVDARTGMVRWRAEHAEAIAAGDGLVVLEGPASLLVVEGPTGDVLAAIPRQRRAEAVVAEDAAVVLSGAAITVVDADGNRRLVTDEADRRNRIVAATADTIVLERPHRGGRVVTAYHLGTGDELWSERFPRYRRADIVNGSLVLVQAEVTTVVDLATGTAATRSEPVPIGSRSRVSRRSFAAAFDPAMAELLWTSRFVEDRDAVGAIDNLVALVEITDNRACEDSGGVVNILDRSGRLTCLPIE